jgi:acyl carrier protein
MIERDKLVLKLKENIIKYLNLLDLAPNDIDNEQALFGDGMGLDSIDSIELAVMLEREYGIKINDPKEGRKIFVNINTMVDYILQNSGKITS